MSLRVAVCRRILCRNPKSRNSLKWRKLWRIVPGAIAADLRFGPILFRNALAPLGGRAMPGLFSVAFG